MVGNLTYGNGDHGIDNNAAPNQVIVGNTVQGNVTVGINLEGASSPGSGGATVANNVLLDNGLLREVGGGTSGGSAGNIRVDAQSQAGTTLDYNLYDLSPVEGGTVQVVWVGAGSYTSLAAFHAAQPTQEIHGLQASSLLAAPATVAERPASDPYNVAVNVGDYHLTAGSAAIDSANADATGEPALDIEGQARVDDPATTDTGAGTRTYDDRGAYEFVPSAGGDPSLIAYWTMDETGGATAHDTGAAPANDAALSGSPTFGTGRIGNALSLDGSTQYGTVADEASLDITDAITIAAWVRPEKFATQDLIAKDINGSVDGYQLSLATTKGDSSSQRAFVRFNQASNGDSIRLNATTMYPIDGTWMHVAATYDGATIKLYINGHLEGSLPWAGTIATNATALGIGAQSDDTRWFQGDLDDVRLYDRALSAGEIAALAETPNQAPLCSGVSLSTAQDTAADAAPDCTDPDGDALSYAIVDQPGHGTASVVADQLHYVPEAGYTGDDAFTYQATDGELDSNTATVGVTVTPPGDPSLIAYWTMDETGGATAHDTGAAPANDAALSGSPTFGTGRIGNALSLDGSTQYGTVADEASLDITDAITIAAWVRPEKFATQDLIAKDINGSVDGYQLSLATTKGGSSSQRAFVRFNQATSGDDVRVNAATMYPIDGTWMHLAATYDGSIIKLYVNGALEGSLPWAGTIATNATALGIGAQSDDTRWFQGDLDDVRLYDRALSAGEIAALAETPNQAPLCSGVSLSTAQDTAADAAPDCTDPDGDALSYAIVDRLRHGTASVAGDQLHYVPEAGYTGDDAFTYQATDGELDSNTATVGVTVTPPGDPSLIAYWTMDETGGATAHDTGAAPANDAALSGSPTFGTGRIGNALSLDGSTQYGTVADEASLDITDAITIAAWIEPAKLATQHLVQKGTMGAPNGYELSLASTGKVFFRLNNTAATRIDSTTLYPTDGHTWMHVAVTWDGSDMRIYVNGVAEGGTVAGPAAIATNSNPLVIGAVSDLTYKFQGAIDDVRIYNRALSAGEIAALAIGSLDHIVISPSIASIVTGATQAYTAEGFDALDNSLGDVTGDTVFTIDGAGICTLAACGSDVPGDYTVTGTNGTFTDDAALTVALDTYTLTYTAGAGGTIEGDSPQTVDYGTDGTAVSAVPDTGYHFVAWSDTSTDNPRTDTHVTGDITVSASFALDTYTLTYTAGAGGTIEGDSPQTVDYGTDGTAVSAVPDTGYHFVAWSDTSTDNPRTDTHVTGDITVSASFALDTYTLTYTAGAGGTIEGDSPQTVDYGTDGTAVSAVPDTGYHFVAWSDTSTDNPRTDTHVTGDITVSASFALDTYTLTYTAGAGGTIEGDSPQTVDYGTDGTAVSAVPDTGYHFVAWSDTSTDNPRTDTHVTGDITVSASFALDTSLLQGTVTVLASGDPVAGATVSAWDATSGAWTGAGVTNGSGSTRSACPPAPTTSISRVAASPRPGMAAPARPPRPMWM